MQADLLLTDTSYPLRFAGFRTAASSWILHPFRYTQRPGLAHHRLRQGSRSKLTNGT